MKSGKDTVYTIDLDFEERNDVKGWKSFELSSTVTSDSVSRGSTSTTAYSLQPIVWLKQAMEAAKENMVYQPLVRQEVTDQAQLVIPKMTKQMAASDWETSHAEYTTANTDIAFTDITNRDGVIFEPDDESYGVAVSNKALRKNALNLVEEYQKDLQKRMSYVIDQEIIYAFNPSGSDGAGTDSGATEMSNSAAGTQTIFGGDATTAADSLNDGDVLTPAIIKKMKRLLMSDKGYYWTGDTFTPSDTSKNPWMNDSGGSFYMTIRPESEEALLGSSQFTNAAEFGADSVIKTGQVGKYMGVNIASTTMLPTYDDSDTVYVQGSTTALDTNVHEVFMHKANYFAGLVWGVKPRMHVFDYPSQLQKRMVIEMAYETQPLYDDATVRAIVTDE